MSFNLIDVDSFGSCSGDESEVEDSLGGVTMIFPSNGDEGRGTDEATLQIIDTADWSGLCWSQMSVSALLKACLECQLSSSSLLLVSVVHSGLGGARGAVCTPTDSAR